MKNMKTGGTAFKKKKKAQHLGHSMGKDLIKEEPVSYTHLDVYKRQVIHYNLCCITNKLTFVSSV